MPQALRISVPSLSNTFISTVKDTSLASLVWIAELFRVAQNITAENYEFILIYSEAALIYWVFCFCAVDGTNPFRKTPFSPFIRTVYVKSHEYSEKF